MQCISMPNMSDMFFQLMLKDDWLIERPELHARVSAIQDPMWQGKFVESIRSTATAVSDCESLLKQYDDYKQGYHDMMQDGGPARTEDDIIAAFEDAAEQARKTPDDIEAAQRLTTKCHVMEDEWADQVKFHFGNPKEQLKQRTRRMTQDSEVHWMPAAAFQQHASTAADEGVGDDAGDVQHLYELFHTSTHGWYD